MVRNEDSFVVLIDTCAMAPLSLYVKACDALGVRLGTSEKSIESEFKKKGVEKDYLEFPQIKNGLSLYHYLQQKSGPGKDLSVLFSCLSEAELLNILLDRVFDEQLTRRGVPYRIRKKKPFRVQVDFDYEKEVFKNWWNTKEKLGENDIEFRCPEIEEDKLMIDTIKVSRIVNRYVALDAVDLYLYSLAVFQRADEIYTYDVEFRTIVKNIRNRNGSWRDISDKIQNGLKEYIRSFEDEFDKEGKITLPDAVKS